MYYRPTGISATAVACALPTDRRPLSPPPRSAGPALGESKVCYHFWARGYCVSTIGLAEEVIRDYIRKQEADEKKQEKLELG